MSDDIVVERVGADAFRIEARGHILFADQPGSGEIGATPTELFVMSLASCVAYYATRALGRGSEHARLSVGCRWSMSETKPWRVTSVDLTVRPPAGVSPERLAAIDRAMRQCTVHNTLLQPPEVTIRLAAGQGVAA